MSSAALLSEEQCSELCTQLSSMTAEIVVTQIANPDLVDRLPVGCCVMGVNGESIMDVDYEAALSQIKSALPMRPLTLQFIRPDGAGTIEHEFTEPGPLMLRFSHRIKFLNDQLHAVETCLLTSPKSRRKELKAVVEGMEIAIMSSASTYAATQSNRTRRKSMADMGGLSMPEMGDDQPTTGGAAVAAGAAVGERLIGLRARVAELETENTELKTQVAAKQGGSSTFGF